MHAYACVCARVRARAHARAHKLRTTASVRTTSAVVLSGGDYFINFTTVVKSFDSVISLVGRVYRDAVTWRGVLVEVGGGAGVTRYTAARDAPVVAAPAAAAAAAVAAAAAAAAAAATATATQSAA